MTKEEINFAFNGRWRIKSEGLVESDIEGLEDSEIRNLTGKQIKNLCRDFFEAGILLGEGFRTVDVDFDNGQKGTITFKKDLEVDTFDGGFSVFWELYEKKVGRPKCEKLWSKLTIKEREECIAYIPLYKKAQPDKQYRKNPETFLRNKSWNDELIFRGNGKSTKPDAAERLTDILIG